MALSAFTITGGGNVSVGPTPLAVQVVGPTIVLTNLSKDTMVFGSLGGSGTLTGFTSGFVSGAPLGSASALFGNTGTGNNGFAIAPQSTSEPIAIGSNSYLWLQTLSGQAAVNVANGT